MAWFSNKIKVTLVDAADGKIIGITKLRPNELPDSFEAGTILHLGDQDWAVIDADSRMRADYVRARALTLQLQRLAYADPRDVLFSLPSICARIPDLVENSTARASVVIHEDDWRQFEFVATKHYAAIERQFNAIRRIHEEHRREHGWREIHSRTEPDFPTAGAFTLDNLGRRAGCGPIVSDVSIGEAKNIVADGFSIKTEDGLSLYGQAPEGKVAVLSVLDKQPGTTPEAAINMLVGLAKEFDLQLVHWCRCQRAQPSWDSFRELIMRGTR